MGVLGQLRDISEAQSFVYIDLTLSELSFGENLPSSTFLLLEAMFKLI